MFKAQRKAVLLKPETVYGTDSVPTGAANAIELSNVEANVFDAEYIDRQRVKPHLGNDEQLTALKRISLNFDVPIAGSGAAGTAPAWGPILRACGFAETINIGVDVQYDPVSENEESASIYFFHAGARHRALGLRGGLQLVFNARQEPVFRVQTMGLYVPLDVQAFPTLTLTPWQDSVPVSNANTPTFALDGFAAVLESIELNMGTEIAHIDRVNSERIDIPNRAPTGTCQIETPDPAVKDFFALAGANPPTVVNGQLVHGATAGNIAQVDFRSQLKSPNYGESNNVSMLSLELHPVPTDVGDDELKITAK